MKIGFVDRTPFDYTPLTPYERPLGGSQSALSYLASALASRGHLVGLANHSRVAGTFGGVVCAGASAQFSAEFLNSFDVLICTAAIGRELRRGNTIRPPLILWTQHHIDQAPIAALKDADERDSWRAFALVSNWQAERYAAKFGLPKGRIRVLRNAISPAVEQARRAGPLFFEAGRPPAMVYTSTPFRGLDILLTIFPTLRAAIPGARLRVYSGMAVYQESAEQDQYRLLYRLCGAIEGAEYVGPVGQTRLAAALAEADVLIYPNTFLETSCIALMEAMASGCVIITTANGALPETAAGFGHLFRPPTPTMGVLGFAQAFADYAIAELGKLVAAPAHARASVEAQAEHARKHYVWSARATEWESWLAALLAET